MRCVFWLGIPVSHRAIRDPQSRVTPTMRKLILNRVLASEMDEMARAEGMVGHRAQGIRMVVEGKTTIEEVLRVVQVPDC